VGKIFGEISKVVTKYDGSLRSASAMLSRFSQEFQDPMRMIQLEELKTAESIVHAACSI
jgi:hypothetical protein